MRNQAEKEFKQRPAAPSEKQYSSILNKMGAANNNSSLRMFLEELKSDDNRAPLAYQGGHSNGRANLN